MSQESRSDNTTITIGDRVLLYLDPRRTWLVQINNDSQNFHTHAGIIDLKSVLGKRFGDSVFTTLNEKILIMRPTVLDYVMKSERRTQIVYPKDFAYITARSGLRSGSRILECGTGSGALTTYFASIVAPTGVVRTFEEREDFYSISGKNIEKASMSQYVQREKGNLKEAQIPETDFDLVMLDTGDPWTLLEIAHNALKGSGFVFCVCPTTNQVENCAVEMEGRFADIEAVEIFLRRIEARAGKTRPSMRMIGHTCYLISGRKVNKEQA